jgi:hypothetical protein
MGLFRPIESILLAGAVRFSPKATAVLHCRKMTRCATNYKWPEKTADAPPPGTAE